MITSTLLERPQSYSPTAADFYSDNGCFILPNALSPAKVASLRADGKEIAYSD